MYCFVNLCHGRVTEINLIYYGRVFKRQDMKANSATTAIFFNKWVPNKEGKCPVSIRVTFDRKKRLYPTKHALSPEEYQKVLGSSPRGVYKDIGLSLQAYENKAAEIINQLPLFTFEAFEKRFLSNVGAKDTIKHAFSLKIGDLRDAGRIGTAVTYECAITSLEKFHPEATFAHITPNFLHKYETWMLDQGNGKTTISIYVRTLRSIFNDAISDGLIAKEQYPFGRRKYEIPAGRNIKKALSLKEIELIFNYTPESDSEEMARDYWVFLYLANGMNVKDMALLKYENIKGKYIEFERAKTVNTRRDYEPIQVVLQDRLKSIINKYGNKRKNSDDYIFPILMKNLTPQRQREVIALIVKAINTGMKAISQKLGIEKNLSTYVARHSFASTIKRSGFSYEFIGDALGHSSDKTTRLYLGSFEDERKEEAAKALIDFGKKGKSKVLKSNPK